MSFTSRPEAWSLALLIAVAAPGTGAAQGWKETQLMGAALGSKPAFLGAGAGVSWRDAGRTRLGAAALAGLLDNGEAAGRLEFAWHFMLDPGRRSGSAVYGGGGLALASGPGGRVAARLQLTLGAEQAPAARSGWFFELGLGGGVRAAAGVRWRVPRLAR